MWQFRIYYIAWWNTVSSCRLIKPCNCPHMTPPCPQTLHHMQTRSHPSSLLVLHSRNTIAASGAQPDGGSAQLQINTSPCSKAPRAHNDVNEAGTYNRTEKAQAALRVYVLFSKSSPVLLLQPSLYFTQWIFSGVNHLPSPDIGSSASALTGDGGVGGGGSGGGGGHGNRLVTCTVWGNLLQARSICDGN